MRRIVLFYDLTKNVTKGGGFRMLAKKALIPIGKATENVIYKGLGLDPCDKNLKIQLPIPPI